MVPGLAGLVRLGDEQHHRECVIDPLVTDLERDVGGAVDEGEAREVEALGQRAPTDGALGVGEAVVFTDAAAEAILAAGNVRRLVLDFVVFSEETTARLKETFGDRVAVPE